MAERAGKMNRVIAEQLRAELAKLDGEIAALQNQALGLRRALAVIEGEPVVQPVAEPVQDARRPRAPIKDTVLGLLIDNAATGLNAATVVAVAAQKGIELDRASVSSLLSRLKKEGVLVMDNGVYKPAPSGGASPAINVANLPRAAA